jgi:uncharacterized protein (DUF488 family)
VVSSLCKPENRNKAVSLDLCAAPWGAHAAAQGQTKTKGERVLYTLGYSGWTLEAIQEVAQAHNAVVCDIRYAPFSRHPQWRKHQLVQLLGARYQHVRALGNRNYKSGGPIILSDYETGKQAIAEILATGQSVILMCACKELAHCHRRIAAEQLAADLGVRPMHLTPPKQQCVPEKQGPLFESRK